MLGCSIFSDGSTTRSVCVQIFMSPGLLEVPLKFDTGKSVIEANLPILI